MFTAGEVVSSSLVYVVVCWGRNLRQNGQKRKNLVLLFVENLETLGTWENPDHSPYRTVTKSAAAVDV